MTWYVRASHPDYMTLINKQLGVSVDPDNEGQIIITWPVEADFTAYALSLIHISRSSACRISCRMGHILCSWR